MNNECISILIELTLLQRAFVHTRTNGFSTKKCKPFPYLSAYIMSTEHEGHSKKVSLKGFYSRRLLVQVTLFFSLRAAGSGRAY